jgi:predicted Zn-dependent protease
MNQIRLSFLIFLLLNSVHIFFAKETFQDSNPYHIYLWSCYNQFEKKTSIVKDCFDVLINDDCSVYIYAGYIDYLFSTKQYKTIIQLISKIDSALGDHLETQLTLVKALELSGKNKEAEARIIALQNKFPTNAEVVYGCALAYMRNNQNMQAEKVLNHYLESTTEKPMHFIFYYLKAQIAAHDNKQNQAREYINKCLQLNPSFDQGWLFCGLLHELEGNLNEAISGYRNFLQIVGHDSAVEQQIMSLLLKQQQSSPKTNVREMFEESLMLYRQHQHSLALKRIEHCLQIDSTYRPARLLKIELLCALQQPAEAIQLLQTWIHQAPKEDIWYRTAHLLYQAGIEKDKIIAILEHLEQQNNHNLLPILYLADIHLKNKSLEQAEQYLKKTLALSTNATLKTKIIYQLAILYFNEKNHSAFAQAVDHGLDLEPNFAPLANLAAYYYATKGKNLKKAQKLIEVALAQQKNNPHYLDTQALIWYKEGNYQKAGQLLTQLSAQLSRDFYIQKHLGKTLFKQGHKQLALDVMKKAILCTGPETQKKKCLQIVDQWKTQR